MPSEACLQPAAPARCTEHAENHHPPWALMAEAVLLGNVCCRSTHTTAPWRSLHPRSSPSSARHVAHMQPQSGSGQQPPAAHIPHHRTPPGPPSILLPYGAVLEALELRASHAVLAFCGSFRSGGKVERRIRLPQ